MTTGTIVLAEKFNRATQCGGTTYGRSHVKTWSGGDNASGDRTTPNDYQLLVTDSYDPLIVWGSNANENYTGTLATCFGSGLSYVPLAFDSNDELNFLNKIYSKIHQSKFNAGFAIAESRETLSMIGDTARNLAQAIHHVRHGDMSAAAQALGAKGGSFKILGKSVSNAWLQLQYGWKPLLSDIHSGAEAVANAVNRVHTHKVTSSQQKTGSVDVRPGEVGITTTRILSRRRVVTFSSNANSVAGFGLINPLAIAWEVVPYSFVADWFLPVGAYLEAMGAAPTVIVTSVVESTRDLMYAELNGQGFNTKQIKSFGGAFKSEIFRFNRSVSTHLPTPPLPQFTGTDIKSLSHAASGIALAVQRFSLDDKVVRANAIHLNNSGRLRNKNGNIHTIINFAG